MLKDTAVITCNTHRLLRGENEFYYYVTDVVRCKLQSHKQKSKYTLEAVTVVLPLIASKASFKNQSAQKERAKPTDSSRIFLASHKQLY